ncbi:MAG TPA: glycosyltransferase family 2 protein [Opitutus sp.]|nr:glycosyltransferase family 2 protein [Opitutus sp.]
MSSLRLSIVIVAYRSRDEIGACLASLPPTTAGGVVEVIVVDNSPGDGAGELIRARFPSVNYVPAPTNLGFGRANNLGFAHTDPRGEFVLFLNPDTVANAPALEHCVERLRHDSRIGLISPKLVLADGSMDLACRRSIPTAWDGFCRASGVAARFPRTKLFSGYNLTHLPESASCDVGAINGAFMLAPRRVLQAVAPDGKVFDEAFFMYGDDLDLCLRVARGGWRIVYDGRVSITHLKGVSVAKEFDRMSQAIFDANRDVYLKHFGTTPWARAKWRLLFGLWRRLALWRARQRGHRRVRPL